MTASLYRSHILLRKMLEQYRGYEVESPKISLDDFTTLIQLDGFVRTDAKTPKGRTVAMFLLGKNKEFTKTAGFMSLIRRVKTKVADIIFVTDSPFNVYLTKAISGLPETLKIFNYKRKHFMVEISKIPFACDYQIMSPAQTRKVILNDLKVSPLSLPIIFEDDPAMVWWGGSVGQLIRITADSMIGGRTVKYRVVYPRPGRSGSKKNEDQDDE